jgi:hypothetical protein
MNKYAIRVLLTLLFCLVSFVTASPSPPAHCSQGVKTEWKPKTRKEIHIARLWQYRAKFEAVGIDPVFAIAQAVLEQGWQMRDDYRIWNITWTPNCGRDYVKLDLKYRVYTSLSDAVDDYCALMAKERYCHMSNQGWERQVELIGKTGYAEDKQYVAKLMPIAKTVNNIIKTIP